MGDGQAGTAWGRGRKRRTEAGPPFHADPHQPDTHMKGRSGRSSVVAGAPFFPTSASRPVVGHAHRIHHRHRIPGEPRQEGPQGLQGQGWRGEQGGAEDAAKTKLWAECILVMCCIHPSCQRPLPPHVQAPASPGVGQSGAHHCRQRRQGAAQVRQAQRAALALSPLVYSSCCRRCCCCMFRLAAALLCTTTPPRGVPHPVVSAPASRKSMRMAAPMTSTNAVKRRPLPSRCCRWGHSTVEPSARHTDGCASSRRWASMREKRREMSQEPATRSSSGSQLWIEGGVVLGWEGCIGMA